MTFGRWKVLYKANKRDSKMCDIKYDNFYKLLKRRNFDINKLFKDRQELYMNYKSNKKIRA